MDTPEFTKKTYFKGLDALRCFAALAIVIYHSSLPFQESNKTHFSMLLHNLALAVDLFFLISGFLITYFLLEEKRASKKIDFKRFFTKRILRIFPLYFLIVGISLLMFGKSQQTNYSMFLVFLGNFEMIQQQAWAIAPLTPLWSICIEEHFYLVIPVLIYFIPIKKIPVLLFLIIGVSILFRTYVSLALSGDWMTIYLNTLSRCDVLAIGGLLACWINFNKDKLKITALYPLLALVFLLGVMSFIDFSDFTMFFGATLKKYLFALPALLLLMGLVFVKKETQTLRFLRNNKVIIYLGQISYGIYMYHSIVIFYLADLPFFHNLSLRIAAVVILTILVAACSYQMFEKPILRLKR